MRALRVSPLIKRLGGMKSLQHDLQTLREAAGTCRNCGIWERGTQTVFGEGSVRFSEQPGQDEDLAGKPFVGPAGRLLDEALVEAEPYVLARRRAQALPGNDFRVSRQRGAIAPYITATVHPSSVLRAPDRRLEKNLFVEDLRKVAQALKSLQPFSA